MEDYKQVLERLRGYNLSLFPFDKIKEDVAALKFGLMGIVLHKGKSITRARLNDTNSPFNTRYANQYKPANLNNRFARASSPHNTMFYGAVVPDEVNDIDYKESRVTATIEVSKLLRPTANIYQGEEQITFSRWEVIDDIKLVAICYSQDFIFNSPHTSELNRLYQGFLNTFPRDFVAQSIAVTDFLAAEFSKPNPQEIEHEYLVSAAFAEVAVNYGYAGVYYPSVKANGVGFNVAISPSYVDTRLKLAAVGECTIYKIGRQIMVDNNTVCLISDDTVPFNLKPVAPHEHHGRSNVLQLLHEENRKLVT